MTTYLGKTTTPANADLDTLPQLPSLMVGPLLSQLTGMLPQGGRTVPSLQQYLANNALCNVLDFGAKGDGAANDGPAIQAAIDAAHALGPGAGRIGAPVFFPPGVYRTAQQIVNREGVRLIGHSRVSSIIQADPAFPQNTSVVLLGHATEALTFGCTLEHMAVDCNSVVGSIGVESTKINEFSGLEFVEIYGYMSRGIYIHGSAAQNYILRDLYLLCSATAAGTFYGIDLDGGGDALRGLDGLTVDSLGANSHTAGVRVNNASAFTLSRIHLENCVDGVRIGDVTTCSAFALIGVSGSAPITTVVRITAGQSFSLTGIQDIAGATNVLVDTPRGTTRTDTALPFYAVGDGASFQPVLDLSDTVGAQSTFRTMFVKENLYIGPPGANTGVSRINHGQATLVAGTVTLNSGVASLVGPNTRIFVSRHTPGGAVGALDWDTRAPGTGFRIFSASATDTSVVDFLMIEP